LEAIEVSRQPLKLTLDLEQGNVIEIHE
jgi:hypothetical protein